MMVAKDQRTLMTPGKVAVSSAPGFLVPRMSP